MPEAQRVNPSPSSAAPRRAGNHTEWAPRTGCRTDEFGAVRSVLADVAAGKMVIICEDRGETCHGELAVAADCVTPAAINFMMREARGAICLALPAGRCADLGLLVPDARGGDRAPAALSSSFDAREGVASGLSASGRAHTIRVAAARDVSADSLVQPGHVFPKTALAGGVLARAGATEAAVDLARLAHTSPASSTCTVLDDEGETADAACLAALALRHGIKLVRVSDLITYRLRHDRLIERVVSTTMPTRLGEFAAVGYRSLADGRDLVAMVKGDVAGAEAVPVCMHVECLSGDVFHALSCDCGEQLDTAMSFIEQAGRGVLLYLAADAQTVEWITPSTSRLPSGSTAIRESVQILEDLSVSSAQVLTATSGTTQALSDHGLTVTRQVTIGRPDGAHGRAC
jgi:3,4-dihydroxy 2-butanone 4-phosphate synthase/GTP cyclohydrolase II